MFTIHTRLDIPLPSSHRVFFAPLLYCFETPTGAAPLKLEPPTGCPLVCTLGGAPDGEDAGVTVAHQSLPE
jgi:hypothetical protein